MDLSVILTSLAATVTVIGVIYGFLQNFKAEIKTDINNHKIDIKTDINNHISRLETRMDKFEVRMDKLEERLDARVNKLEERMFWLATGKKLEDAILEEQMKRKKSA